MIIKIKYLRIVIQVEGGVVQCIIDLEVYRA